MRVLIVGTGIIGSIYAWALADGGHRVVHLVRSGRSAALGSGLKLDIIDRRKGHKRNFRGLYRLDAVETLLSDETFELVIVPVKHYRLAANLKEIVPRVRSAEFLLLTQNWCGTTDTAYAESNEPLNSRLRGRRAAVPAATTTTTTNAGCTFHAIR